MTFILPVSALIFGVLLAQFRIAEQCKRIFSALLARLFIPIVIIYNMVFYQPGSLSLILFSFISSLILFYSFLYYSKDRLQALCLSYSNIGWLGFPVAMALFGEQVSAAMIALYIGGSLFGNIWAITALNQESPHFITVCQKLLKSPPVLALLLAAVLTIFGIQRLEGNLFLEQVYTIAKFGMSFTGMCILGMWLRHTRVHMSDLGLSLRTLLIKMFLGVGICTVIYFFAFIPNIDLLIKVMFLLFCLPPAANIVALETHYQGTGDSARYIAAGTMVSCAVIVLYGLSIYVQKVLLS